MIDQVGRAEPACASAGPNSRTPASMRSAVQPRGASSDTVTLQPGTTYWLYVADPRGATSSVMWRLAKGGDWKPEQIVGADVVKVERPGSGDDTRHWGPPYIKDGAGNDSREAAYFQCANRNKQSLTLDFTQPEGQRLVRELAAQCDVLLENFKVGGLAAYGLDYASLRAVNPRLSSSTTSMIMVLGRLSYTTLPTLMPFCLPLPKTSIRVKAVKPPVSRESATLSTASGLMTARIIFIPQHPIPS